MAGKIIRVVYDPKIETSDSLSKFLGIVLDKAKYPIKDIKFVKQEDYIQEIDGGLRQGNYTICLNKTYSVVSLKLSAIYKEPTYKFFSRYYANTEGQVIVVGLQVDVADIFSDDSQKKAAWAKLLTFKRDFDTCSDTPTDTTPEHNTESNSEPKPTPLPVIEKEVTKEAEEVVVDVPVVKKATSRKAPTKKSTPVVAEVSTETVQTPDQEPKPSYEDLLAFYNAWNTLNTLANKLSNGFK